MVAKKQTRRSISTSRETFDVLYAHCVATGESMASFVEARIRESLGMAVKTRFTDPLTEARIELAARIELRRNGPTISPTPLQIAAHHAAVTKRRTTEARARYLAQIEQQEAGEAEAIDHPCRDPKCRVMALHARHQKPIR